MVGDVIDAESVGACNLEMLDNLEADADIPCHLAGLGR